MIESKLGYSSLTEHVYWGKTNSDKPGIWIGDKKDVTENFLNVIIDGYLSKNTKRDIMVDGKIKYSLMNIEHSKESIDRAIKILNEIKSTL
jgi:hypothetical protein